MEDGLLNKKVAFIIQARMQSTRLPGKILMPLPFGSNKPLLEWIVEALKSSRFTNQIIVATSADQSNDVLASFCEANRISIFRGEEDDVLSRFIAIVKNDTFDYVVRLTADNPIVDCTILDDLLTFHDSSGNDYTATEGLPMGMNFEVITASALLDLEKQSLTIADKEHVTLFLKSNKKYKVGSYKPQVNPELKKLRLTVDYPSDYLVVSAVTSVKTKFDNLHGLKLILFCHENYPWIFENNQNNFQKSQYNTVEEELKEALPILEKYEFSKLIALLLEKIDLK